jgi:hypothetical protein
MRKCLIRRGWLAADASVLAAAEGILMPTDIFTLEEYCALEKVSRSKVYDEWRRGEGVEYFKRGAKIFITEEARLAHREKLQRLARQTLSAA